MNLPESLPDRMYLLAYDTGKNRLTSRSELRLVLRAAALTELYLDGRLTDDGGKARVARRGSTGDPLLDELMEQIGAANRPRSWHRWISSRGGTARTVRDRLEAGRWIKVERRAILPDRVEPRDRRAVKQYTEEVRAALRRPAAQIEPRTAAVLALAARGELRTVLSGRERREHREHLRELAVYTGPIADALRKAIRSQRAAAGS